MSQLGGLRNALQFLRSPQDAANVLSWLAHLNDNRRRRQKWPGGAIEQLQAILGPKNREQIWSALKCQGWPSLTDRAEVELKEQLWPLAVRTLIDACIRAHKRGLEPIQGV